MSTLKYQSWSQTGDKLRLRGESIGNGQTIKFDEEYLIKKLTPDELILQQGTEQQIYLRPM